MSKQRALITGLVGVVITIWIISYWTPVYGLADSILGSSAFIIADLIFLGIWYYKHSRDQRIIAKAAVERQKAPQESSTPPPVSSTGSNRLFVPPQIK